jgi:thiamine kinase-like enzyme
MSVRIPKNRNEITVDYLNTVLKNTLLKDNKIVSIKDGETIPPQFKSIVHRILPTYENDDDSLPKSFIIKLATDNPGIKSLLKHIQGYYKEVKFYTSLGKIPELKTPKVYYSAVSSSKSKFIIIMEDLNLRNLNVASQGESIDFNFALNVIKYFALLQSKFWNYEGNSKFKEAEWMKDTNFALYLKDLTIQMFEERKLSFIERNKSKLNEKTVQTIQTVDIKKLYDENFPKDLKHCTVVHGDPQPTNVFIDKANQSIVMVDWQYASIGYALKDVVLLLGIWLSRNTPKEEILKLKDAYYEELIKQGVKDFSREDFEHQWKNCLLLSLCNIASVSENENIGDDEEKKQKYKDYLDLSESRFINFIKNQDF